MSRGSGTGRKVILPKIPTLHAPAADARGWDMTFRMATAASYTPGSLMTTKTVCERRRSYMDPAKPEDNPETTGDDDDESRGEVRWE